jgi:phage FluMu protein gp41
MSIPPSLRQEAHAIRTELDLLAKRVAAMTKAAPPVSPERLAALKQLCLDALALHARSIRLVLAVRIATRKGSTSDRSSTDPD